MSQILFCNFDLTNMKNRQLLAALLPYSAMAGMETLPMLPPKMQLVVIKESSKQFQIVQNLLRRADVSDIIIATDAGREGELVARWILSKAACKKPAKRLWTSCSVRAYTTGRQKLVAHR